MTSSFEFPTHPARLCDAERDKALKVLRDGVAVGRLSHDTFVRRMELALAARRPEELVPLTADLRTEGRLSRLVFGGVEAVSGFGVRLGRAWRAERLPKLLLPHPGTGHPLRIGRDPSSGLRLNHETVSRVHAELSRQGGMWVLRDLGSTNGTTVNGRRVIAAAVVREGDQIGFGRMTFRLAASRPAGPAPLTPG
ncbi:FHA domain-containing protein [Streptomyces parvulus]